MLELQMVDGRGYERAVTDARSLLERAEQLNVAEEVPRIRRVLAEALARSGNRSEALQMFAKAEEGFEAFGSRYEAARVVRVMVELAGERLLPRGKLDARLRDAAKLFRRLRAQPELDRLRAARAKLDDNVKDTTTPAEEADEGVKAARIGRSTVPPQAPEPLPSVGALDTVGKWPRESEQPPPSVPALQIDQLIREFTGILELDRLLERLVDAAIATTGAERGLVIACHRAGDPRVRASRGVGGVDLDGDDLELSRTVVQQVMTSRTRVLWHRASTPPVGKLRESVARLGLCAVVGVPMVAGAELCGVMYLDSRVVTFEWDRDRVERLEQLAEQAAMALVNARKFDEQREKTDILSAAARELRDPLETALGYVERLKGHVGAERSAMAECVHALAEQTQSLAVMLNRLLEVAAMDPAELSWSMVSIQLKELIETALVPVRALAAVVDVELATVVPRGLPTIFGNRERLIHVVESLTSDAVRASVRHGSVSLRVTATPAPAGMPLHTIDPLLAEPTDFELSREHVVSIELCHRPRAELQGDDVNRAIAAKIVARHGGLMWSEQQEQGNKSILSFPVLLQKRSSRALDRSRNSTGRM